MNKQNQLGYYDMVADFLTPNPKDVEGLNNSSYFFYQDQLFLLIHSLLEIENMPEHWNKEYIFDNIFRRGYMCEVEWVGQHYLLNGGYEGQNLYHFPTHVNIANPVLGSFRREIGKTANLVYLGYVNGHFLSLYPLVERYAVLLAQCDGSINVSLMNSRVAHVFVANDDSMKKTMEKVYDEVSMGKPAIFMNKNGVDSPSDLAFFMNAKNSYIANDIQLTKRQIMNEFLTAIGIMNANTDKRERLNQDEVNANNGETMALCSLILNTINECLERGNKLFGLNVRFKFNEKVVKQYQEQIMSASENEVSEDD